MDKVQSTIKKINLDSNEDDLFKTYQIENSGNNAGGASENPGGA